MSKRGVGLKGLAGCSLCWWGRGPEEVLWWVDFSEEQGELGR